MSEKKKPYQLCLGTIKDTGWPIDGHRLALGIWDFSPETFSLIAWNERDDEALMMTLFICEVEAGFEEADGLEAFKKTWDAGEYEWPGAFHFEKDQVCDVKMIDKFPYTEGSIDRKE